MITGATGELGSKLVNFFLNDGDTVLAVGRSAKKLDEKFPHPRSQKLHTYTANLADADSVEDAFGLIEKEHGRIDILVNSAGGYRGGMPIAESPVSDWSAMIDLNLNAAFYCCRKALQIMAKKGGGSIVNISAMTAFERNPQKAAYHVSKAALNSMTQVVAEEGKASNVRVNALAPEIILTDSNKKWMPDADFSKWVTPEQIYDTIRFLASEQGRMVTATIVKLPGKN